MTGDGFRATVESLDRNLSSMSVEDATSVAGRLRRAARRAVDDMHPDDAEESLILVETMIDGLRRKVRRQRRNSQIAAAVSAMTGSALGTVLRLQPPGSGLGTAAVIMICFSAATLLLSLRSLTEATDWRDDVGKALEEIASALAAAVQVVPSAGATYRAPGSTGVRLAPTISREEHHDADDGDTTAEESVGGNPRGKHGRGDPGAP